jgi:hypothetical protein
MEEVKYAMRICGPGKAVGPDSIKNEFLRWGGDSMEKALHMLFQYVWNAECVPGDWLGADVVPIHKSGKRKLVTNYRGIALMSVVAKVYERIIADRLTAYLERTGKLNEEQGGFRGKRGCVDQLFVLTEVLSSRRERNKRTWLAFLDFSKAYDVTWRNGMLARLHEVGIQGKAWRVVKDMYREVRSRVKLHGGHSAWWNCAQGVRQGSVLSPSLLHHHQ